MLVMSILEKQLHKIVKMCEILTICDASGFDDEEGLERMDDLLKDFPVFR